METDLESRAVDIAYGTTSRLCPTGRKEDCIILTGWRCEVHLVQAGTNYWRAPEENNHAGIFIRMHYVDAILVRINVLVIRRGKFLRHCEGGLYQAGTYRPEGMLIRVV